MALDLVASRMHIHVWIILFPFFYLFFYYTMQWTMARFAKGQRGTKLFLIRILFVNAIIPKPGNRLCQILATLVSENSTQGLTTVV